MNKDDENMVAQVAVVLIDYAKTHPSVVNVWLYGKRIWGEPTECGE
jgi:hypothetical protein